MDKPALVILAAGIGSRYGGLKQVDPVGPTGQIILEYSIFDALKAGFGRVIIVIQREMERDFQEHIGTRFAHLVDLHYVFQELHSEVPVGAQVGGRSRPWGTAHAILVSRTAVDGPFCAMNADDFYGPHAFQLLATHLTKGAHGECAMVAYGLRNTLSDHGPVSRGICQLDNGYLQSVHERTHIERVDGLIRFRDDDGTWRTLSGEELVSMNFWGFNFDFYELLAGEFETFLHERGTDPKAEMLIPAVVDRLVHANKLRMKVLQSRDRWFGMTYSEDRPTVIRSIRALVRAGTYPQDLWAEFEPPD